MSAIQLLEIIVLSTHEDEKVPSEPTALLLQVRDQEQEFGVLLPSSRAQGTKHLGQAQR